MSDALPDPAAAGGAGTAGEWPADLAPDPSAGLPPDAAERRLLQALAWRYLRYGWHGKAVVLLMLCRRSPEAGAEVALALAHACLAGGAARRALTTLDAVPEAGLPPAQQRARLRLRARALLALRRTEEARGDYVRALASREGAA